MIATEGWTQTTELPAVDAIKRLTRRGVRSFVYTDVSRDGKLTGPDLEGVERGRRRRARPLPLLGRDRLARRTCARWRELRRVNLAGVIAGKSLYEKKFTVAEGQAALDGA